MKVLAFMGSPRLGSNTDILVDKTIDGVKSKNTEVEKVNLVDYQDEVCTACGKCRSTGECVNYDKTNKLLQKMKISDAFIFGTPTWWISMSSLMKIYTDHFGAFIGPNYSSRIGGKSAVILSCCGSPQMNIAEQVCEQMKQMLGFLKVDVKGILGVSGLTEKGAVVNNKEALDKAFELGEKLVK